MEYNWGSAEVGRHNFLVFCVHLDWLLGHTRQQVSVTEGKRHSLSLSRDNSRALNSNSFPGIDEFMPSLGISSINLELFCLFD